MLNLILTIAAIFLVLAVIVFVLLRLYSKASVLDRYTTPRH
ncbi:hypothetical protein [Formosa sp. S-31]